VASYEAQINVILNGQRSIDALTSSLGEVQAAIDQIERRWRSATQLIQRTQIRLNAIGTEPPRGQGGRFTRDPNRQARFEAYAVQRRARQEEFLSRRATARGRSEEAIVGNQITGQREAIRLAERRAEIESRQNSAAILFERQLQAFRRGGGGTRLDPQLQERAREAQAAYNAIGGAASRNRGLVSALATEMGRVVQAQNEVNRGSSLRSKAFETSRSAFERISALQEQGTVSRSRIARARRLATPIAEAANAGDQFGSSEAARRASVFISRLEKESRSLQNRTRETIKNAISSPVQGGVNFPGSPLALREAARINERLAAQNIRNAASSPIRGGANFPGSPIATRETAKAIDKAMAQGIKNAVSSPIRGGINFPGSPIALRESEKAIGRAMAQGIKNAVSSPIRGGAGFPGSPIALQESRKAVQQAMAQSAKNAISSPIRGGANFPGSPIAIKETEKAIERAMAQGIKNAISSPIRGGTGFPGSPIAIEEARRQGIKNALSSPIRGGLNFPGSPIAVEAAMRGRGAGYPSSPIGGGVNMPGSPIFNQTPFLERRFGRKGGAAISEGLIGGAFPLLFGQGLGASAGGGLGGALGGFAGGGLGFGLSLIGTAVGSALDGVANAAKDAAASLQDPITNFQKLADAGLLASKSQELQIKNLIEYGNSTKAAAIIQEELAKKIGVLGMRDMANLDDQSVRLGKAWAELSLQIQAAIAGPLAGLLEWTANMINLFTGGTRKKVDEQNFIDSLPADVKKEYIKQKQANLYGAQSDAALRAKFQGQAGPLNMPATKINPERLQEEQDKIRQENRDKDDKQLQRKIEAEDLIRNSQNQSRQFEYQLIDLKRQAIDLQRRVNDDIFNKQQQIQRDQISNDRLRKQIAIDTVDLQYSKMISNEEGRAAAVLSAEADLVRMRSTNAAEIEVARRSLEIDIAKQQRDTQNYIYGLAREADSIRRATLNYEVQIEDYRIAQERKIAEIRRGVMREEEDIQTKRDRGSPVYQGAGYSGAAPSGKVVSIGGGHSLDSAAAGAYQQMVADAAAQGVRISLTSSYRDNAEQAILYQRYLNGTGNLAAPPGRSGHNRGTSLDVRTGIEWMQRNGQKYGWHNTGMSFSQKEPWHFDYKSGKMQQGKAAPAAGRTNTEAAIAKVNTNDAVVQARPVISGVPVSKIGGQQIALDNQGSKIKQDAIALQEKFNKLGEEGALQRVIEAARGENTVKQKTQELRLTKAEAGSIGAMAADKQAIATFDARSLETQKQIEEENKRIIERTSKSNAYNAKEKKAIADAAKQYLENAKKSLDVDRQMLQVSQQMRFNSEMAAMELEFQTRGAGAKAGFFGAGAQAYNQELVNGSGDPAKAAEKAQSTRRNEVNNEIVQMRENIQSLIDPTNQVIGGAKAIGDAFSEGFKGVVSGSVTGRDALADFFQKTGQHFLEMATQMMAQKMILELIGFGLKSFGLSGGSGIANKFELPGAGFMPTGGFKPFANGGMFTNSIVSSPTLFQFADGAALSNGVAGEAGPEAIMPLSRGRGGRLGVDASGMMSASRDALQQASQEVAASREALQQVSKGGSSGTGSNGYTPQSKLFAESRQALATSTRSQSVTTSSSSAPLKIETIRIGSLDVVTVEQAKAIADASSVRGNAKQTRLLQSSPSARRSMGI